MKILTYTSRKKWLQGRDTRVSATDIPVLMGTNTNNQGKQYKTEEELILKKLGLAPKEEIRMPQLLEFGNDMEGAIARRVGWQKPGWSVIDPGPMTVQVHPKHDWTSCTADFFVQSKENASLTFPLETKTGPRKKWLSPPAYYVDQLQWQMFVCGMDRGWLAVMLLPEHEESRSVTSMEGGWAREVPATLREEYFAACELAGPEARYGDRAGGIPRILRAVDESEVRIFEYEADRDRQAEMLHRAGAFRKELLKRKKEMK